MTRIQHHDTKNARLTGGKVPYNVVTAKGNTMPEPRMADFSLFSVRSGTVINEEKVVSGNVFVSTLCMERGSVLRRRIILVLEVFKNSLLSS
jgi:hypothetical protein